MSAYTCKHILATFHIRIYHIYYSLISAQSLVLLHPGTDGSPVPKYKS